MVLINLHHKAIPHRFPPLILASGDKTADLISVNDEMISEFKYKGYLVPLEETVMTEETRKGFPQKYLESICEADGHIYSVPFQMDMMMFWVNQELLNYAGLDEIKDMEIAVKQDVADSELRDEDMFRINEKIKDLERQILNIIEG